MPMTRSVGSTAKAHGREHQSWGGRGGCCHAPPMPTMRRGPPGEHQTLTPHCTARISVVAFSPRRSSGRSGYGRLAEVGRVPYAAAGGQVRLGVRSSAEVLPQRAHSTPPPLEGKPQNASGKACSVCSPPYCLR